MQVEYCTVREQCGGRDFRDKRSELPSGGRQPPGVFREPAVLADYLKGRHEKIQLACRATRVVRRGIDIRRSRHRIRSERRPCLPARRRAIRKCSCSEPLFRAMRSGALPPLSHTVRKRSPWLRLAGGSIHGVSTVAATLPQCEHASFMPRQRPSASQGRLSAEENPGSPQPDGANQLASSFAKEPLLLVADQESSQATSGGRIVGPPGFRPYG
jgi:hypothetical protein